MLTWFIVGTFLILLEFVTPTFVLIFFGLGAWGASFMAYIYPGAAQEIITFMLVTCVSLFFLRQKVKKIFTGFQGGKQKDTPPQNFAYLGKEARVNKEIFPHQEGEVFVGGSFWRAKAQVHIPKESIVIVTAQDPEDNLLLIVNPQND